MVDLTEALPLYQRVYRLLADDIGRGLLRPGDRLPAERTLCDRLNVSRATVRRALAELVADGLIEASVGRGSFVSGGPLSEPPNALMSFTDLGRARGLVPTARVLSARSRPATFEEAEAFGIVPGADVLVLQRLRLLDGLPVAVDRSRLPVTRAPNLATVDFTKASVYATLDAAGISPTRAEFTGEATRASAEDAELLDLVEGDPALVTRTTSRDVTNRVVEMAETVYRADRYRFTATLTRPRPPAPPGDSQPSAGAAPPRAVV
jgi:GntR family transcriptional regulator